MGRKPGKYEHVLNERNLPRLPTVEPERADIVDMTKQDILATTMPVDTTGIGTLNDLLDEIANTFKIILDINKRTIGNKRYAAEFGRGYAEARKIRDRLAQLDTSIGLLVDAYQLLMIEQLEAEGVTHLTLANGQTISMHYEPYVSVEDKEAFRLWCIAQGLERSMSLHPSTTASLCKKMLLAGDPEPPGIKLSSNVKVRLSSE